MCNENDPSPRQLQVLRFIARHRDAKGFAPSVAEICTELGITSTNGAMAHLQALKKKGLITWTPHLARTLVLSDRAGAFVREAA